MEVVMEELVEQMIDYIYENELTPDYLMTIGIPYPIVMGKAMMDSNGFKVVVPLNEYLDEIAENMEEFMFEEIKLGDEKTLADIRLSTLLHKFDLPICPFWLTFCDLVKCFYTEGIFS